MSLSKRLDQARKAYLEGDTQASQAAHTAQAIQQASEEHGGTSHQYIGDMVYGGLDGIVTTFAVVSGVAGAELGASIILIMGLANLLADGFSMAAGAYLSSKSEREYYQHEREREAWEVEHFPDGEKAELIEVYLENGYTQEDAEQIVAIQSRDKKRFVDAMMVHELGLLPDERRPIFSAGGDFYRLSHRRLSSLDDLSDQSSHPGGGRGLVSRFAGPFGRGPLCPGGGQGVRHRPQLVP